MLRIKTLIIMLINGKKRVLTKNILWKVPFLILIMCVNQNNSALKGILMLSTEENLSIVKEMAGALCFTRKIVSMKVNGSMICVQVKVLRDIQMETDMKVTFKTEKQTVRVFTPGSMARYMMENGKMELKKVMVFGKECSEILISESGRIVKLMVMVYINGKTVIDMKVNGKIVLNLVKAQTYLLMGIHTLAVMF